MTRCVTLELWTLHPQHPPSCFSFIECVKRRSFSIIGRVLLWQSFQLFFLVVSFHADHISSPSPPSFINFLFYLRNWKKFFFFLATSNFLLEGTSMEEIDFFFDGGPDNLLTKS